MKRPLPIYITNFSTTHNPNRSVVLDHQITYEEADTTITGEFMLDCFSTDLSEIMKPGKRHLIIDYESMIRVTQFLLTSVRGNKIDWLTSAEKDKREFAEWLVKEGLL